MVPASEEVVRENVLVEVEREIRDLASDGLSTRQIGESLNATRTLTEAEHDVVYLLTYHAVAASQKKD
jgi:hypothetical protein